MLKNKLKRWLSVAVSAVMMCSTASILSNNTAVVKATQSMSGNFLGGYSLTGNGATDIVNVAMAQNNRSQSSMGYSEAWCADFVSDCAKLANQSSAVPFSGSVQAVYNGVIGAGGSIVTSPQAGDLVIYNGYCHIGIMVDSTNSIQGNVGGQVYYMRPSSYIDVNGASVSYFYVRPNYTKIDPTPTGHVMSESEGAGQTIPDGEYWICSRLYPRYLIDIPGTTTEVPDQTNVQMWQYGDSGYSFGGIYDVFTIEYLNNGFYKIKQFNSNSVIEVYGADLHRGSNVNMFGDNGSIAQQWSIEKSDNGYKIRSRANNYYMDIVDGNVNGTNTKNGANVFTWDFNGDEGLFSFIPYKGRTIDDGTYTIGSVVDNSFYVSADSKETYKDGTNIQVSNKENVNTFRFEYVSNGYYNIFETSSGLALTADNNGDNYLTNGGNVCLRKPCQMLRQLWAIKPENEGYVLISKLNGYAFDLQGAVAENDKNVFLHIFHGEDNQLWELNPVDDVEVMKPISNIKIENITSTGYDISCDVDASWGASKIQFPTWTIANGQDDLIWHEGTISNGKARFHLNTADHTKQTGTYRTHIYLWDESGNSYCVAADDVEVPKVISNIRISNVDAKGYTIECDIDQDWGAKKIQFPTWSDKNSQDDLIWHNGVIKDDHAVFQLNVKDHNGETGIYITHIYIYDANDNACSVAVPGVYVGLLEGDVNADGKFDIADVVLLQKWLLAVPDTNLPNWKAADMYEDNKLDVFDLCMMKSKLING